MILFVRQVEVFFFFFFQAEDGIRDRDVTGVQTCALPILEQVLPAQQQGWKDLFQSARRLKASLTVTAVKVVGGTAEAIVTGVYDYDNVRTGRTERLPVTFRAILIAETAGWRLATVR